MEEQPKRAVGLRAEEHVARILADIPNTVLFRNVYVARDGGTAEIDAVLLSPRGLLVVEVKHFTHGRITSSVQRYEWVRTYRKKGAATATKTPFYNPIRQNRRHIEALSLKLDIPKSLCHSVIVFHPGATLVKVPAPTSEFTVLQTGSLRSFAERRMSADPNRLTAEKRSRVAKALQAMAGAMDDEKRWGHVQRANRAEKLRMQAQERRRERRLRGR